jgi:hypothetical protein
MKKLLIALSGLCLAAGIGSADIGQVLGNGTGARGGGMGFAQVSAAKGVEGIYWNPATLTAVQTIQLSTYASEIYGTSYKTLGIAFPALAGKCGILMLNAGQSGMQETTLDLGGRPVPTGNLFGYSATAVYFSYAREFGGFSFGTNLKYLTESLQSNGANGVGLDVGVLAKPYPTVMLGAKYENLIAPQMKWNTASGNIDKIESLFRGGISLVPENGKYSISGDLSIGENNQVELFAGGEYNLVNSLILRGGLFSGRPTIGIGFGYKDFTVDYSYIKGSDILEDAQRVSLNFSLSGRSSISSQTALANRL